MSIEVKYTTRHGIELEKALIKITELSYDNLTKNINYIVGIYASLEAKEACKPCLDHKSYKFTADNTSGKTYIDQAYEHLISFDEFNNGESV